MKRVCMFVFTSLDPDPRVWKESKTLALQGFDVTILAIRREGQKKDEWTDGFRILRIFSDYPLKFWNVLAMAKAWAEYIFFLFDRKRMPFGICHCHDPDTLLFGYAMSVKDRAALIYDAHEFFLDFMPPMKRPFVRLLKKMNHFFTRILPERLFISKCHYVLTVNASISRLLKASYHLKERPTFLLNTLPYQREAKKPDNTQHRSPGGKKFILFQGTISWDRQVERIIEIMPKLNPPIVLRLRGPISPRFRQELSNLARKKGVYDRIEFSQVPYRNLIEETARNDVGICLLEPKSLSYKYSLPNKFFEYIFAGIPVIVSDLPEMKKITKRFQIGEVVNIQDPDDMISGIQKVLEKADANWYRDRLALARKALCWENEEGKLIEIYRRLSSFDGMR